MTRRKHWYEIRAWADGWEIEWLIGQGWTPTENPGFAESYQYRVVPDSEGWLPWYGGESPLKPGEEAEVNFRTMKGGPTKYGDGLRWADTGAQTDVIAYRIIKENDPYAELKAAAKDPTKQIKHCGRWFDFGPPEFAWNAPVENYEIRDKPKTKTKKVKLLAWITDSGTFFRAIDGTYVSSVWKRVPSEDKEIEVEF